MPGAGVEPARGRPRRILSPVRLPIPPSGHSLYYIINLTPRQVQLRNKERSGFMREITLPFSESEWENLSLQTNEKVLLSGRIFIGGDEALDKLMYLTEQDIMLNLELNGEVWLYALASRDFVQPEWVSSILPESYFRLFGEFGLSLAGLTPMNADMWLKYGVHGLVPEYKDNWFSKDRIKRIKSVWWFNQGMRFALWELEVNRLGAFVIVS